MLLIGSYHSPFARRVAVALISRGIPYEHDSLNGYADPIRARALNPVGKVPVLQIDHEEDLIDSAAILDHINELVSADNALLPPSGPKRRAVLRLAAIAATICELCTARSFEKRRPAREVQIDLVNRYQLAIRGGLQALDDASNTDGLIGGKPFSIATISAVVAFDYAIMTSPELNPAGIAPSLAAVAAALADDPAFAQTHPQST